MADKIDKIIDRIKKGESKASALKGLTESELKAFVNRSVDGGTAIKAAAMTSYKRLIQSDKKAHLIA